MTAAESLCLDRTDSQSNAQFARNCHAPEALDAGQVEREDGGAGAVTNAPLEAHLAYVRWLVEQGGPCESDDARLSAVLTDVASRIRSGQLAELELAQLRAAFGRALGEGTMQGFALTKPYGYAGDFEIIDRMYRGHRSSDPQLVRWDRFYHAQAAAKAVRNRKDYFHALLDQHVARRSSLRVLKIASGPGRSMFEWMSRNPQAPVNFECVEVDPQAIRFAEQLNRPFRDRVTFVEKNALRYRATAKHDVIWAAGIFDYFNDKVFVSLLQRLLPALDDGGEIVIGNFSDRNPSRPYMELVCGWELHHRSAADLIRLAEQCGVASNRITIGREPEGVNLFLHVR